MAFPRSARGWPSDGSQGSRLVYPCADGVSFARMPDSSARLPNGWWPKASGQRSMSGWLAALLQAGRHMAPRAHRRLTLAVERLFAAAEGRDLQRGASAALMTSRLQPRRSDPERPARRAARTGEKPTSELGRTATAPGPPVRITARHLAPAQPSYRPRQRPPSPDPRRGIFSWVGVAPCATQQLGSSAPRSSASNPPASSIRSGRPQARADPNASAYWANCNRDKARHHPRPSPPGRPRYRPPDRRVRRWWS
jgi:hypothetical protein